MKTILLATDFSANAKHAVLYGYQLARLMKADVVLCNAIVIPAEIPQAGFVTWSANEYDMLLDGSTEGLKQLKHELTQKNNTEGFKPVITCVNEAGLLADVLNAIIARQKIDLVIMGTHGSSGLGSFILGNHSRSMIDALKAPLLLVPVQAQVGEVKKIAFATDFKQPLQDMDYIYSLTPLAGAFNAEILLTHIYDEKQAPDIFQKQIKPLLTELINKAHYTAIYYQAIKNNKTEAGLNWLCQHDNIDMLAMVHRQHSFLNGLLNASHTKKMAGHIGVPLLVYPDKA